MIRTLRTAVRIGRRRPRGVDLSHPARSPLGSAVVNCAVYRDGQRQQGNLPAADAIRRVREDRPAVPAQGSGGRGRPPGFVWIGLHEPAYEEFADVAELFGLHPLAVANALQAHQRPKVERYAADTLFAVFKTVRYVGNDRSTATSEIVETGEIMAFVGPDFVITIRHGGHGSLGPVREELEARAELLTHGPAAVLYAIADHVVDDYLAVTDAVQDDIDAVESEVFAPAPQGRAPRRFGRAGRSDPSASSAPSDGSGRSVRSARSGHTGHAGRAGRTDEVERIYQLKRELLELKRAVAPLERPLHALATQPSRLVDEDVRAYLRHVADRLTRVAEQVTSFDDLLNSILQAGLAQVTVAQNEDLRRISAWVAIIAVPTMVCGLYGMNFDHMPELGWSFGYPATLASLVAVCLLLHRAFRRSGWL
ncbi:magnesium and cobalt transport protein CorA [Streptomyces sp. AC536]|uniref:magnesium and cobalt transport protein CorA n=1 Tax=Streptomyces buecherae TaxID=2763006 RepID=UPI00164CEECF|nr:magnesium and cobalt transport protein CorA [Streptomyces buecherae]MBC3985596.1 magnesium and cobalt transport protein CorA [Streptomyces buecherae]QNJ40180.1 magnesium and cobalt transport protein CorA [Streptomyces buecherae]